MDRAGRSLLHYAAMHNDVSTVTRLLDDGELPDVQDDLGFAPLHLAAQEFSVAAAKALLGGGATVDIQNSFGNTPLFVAVFNSNGRGDLIQLLRSHGANPLHLNSSGQTPAGLARLIGNYDVARYFEDMPE
jgi:ankyrin repeat protein